MDFNEPMNFMNHSNNNHETETKIIPVRYLLNDDSQMQKTEIQLNKNILLYDEIKFYFFDSLKKELLKIDKDNEDGDTITINDSELNFENISFDYIRYSIDNKWLLLEKNEFIDLDDEDNTEIKLMIKIKTISQEKLNLNNLHNIRTKEINELNEKINNLLNNKLNLQNNKICSNTNLDLVVLIANPLMNGDKELRTMNDFNKILCSIQRAIQKSLNSISVEFWPLTESRLIEILEHKPTILHLICKSTYVVPDNIPEGNHSNNYVNLIFEKDDHNAHFISRNELIEKIKLISDEIKKNIKDITLIISTQFAEDVYKMFKDIGEELSKEKSLGFRNILVQPTTLTDIDYISEFNLNFYTNIIFSGGEKINELYKIALYSCQYDNIFCCCFHSHKNYEGKVCPIMKNEINELYFEKDEGSKNITEIIPHFCHLKRKEKTTYFYNHQKNFCKMHAQLFKKFQEDIQGFYKNKTKIDKNHYNLCCCNEPNHNIDSIFFKDFNENENNNMIKFGGKTKLERNKYIPDFSKFDLLVGRNKIIYDVIVNIKNIEPNNNINIFFENKKEDESSSSDLKELVDIIIEYMKERDIEEEIDGDNLTRINLSRENIELNPKEIEFREIKSSPNLCNKNYKIIDLTNQESNKSNKIRELDKINIYFIILDDNFSKDLIKKYNKYKVVFLSMNQIQIEGIEGLKPIKIENWRITSLYNEYIRGQLNKVSEALYKKDKKK